MKINVLPATEIIMLTTVEFVSEFKRNANSGKSVESVPDAHTDGQLILKENAKLSHDMRIIYLPLFYKSKICSILKIINIDLEI